MNQLLINLILFIAICMFLYLLFANLNIKNVEGMTNVKTSLQNGVAGNAMSYASSLKTENIKSQDIFLISKYKSDYETAILNLDEFIDNLMLKVALSFNINDPNDNIKQLVELNQAKMSLNNVMKFIDK